MASVGGQHQSSANKSAVYGYKLRLPVGTRMLDTVYCLFVILLLCITSYCTIDILS